MKLSVLFSCTLAKKPAFFDPRSPHLRSTIDPTMCFESLGQFRSEDNGEITCSSRQCKLKCNPGYQTYGAKATVKCIRTRKGTFKWNRDFGVCRTCNPLKVDESQVEETCKILRNGIKQCKFTCNSGSGSSLMYPMKRTMIFAQCKCKSSSADGGNRCYWRMKPNNALLDHGNKHHAEKWTCQAPDQSPVVEEEPEVESPGKAENRIPKGLSCENPDRIINGITAERGSWPWIAYIKFGFSFCGGTIIDSETILTAAHCCNNYDSPSKYDRIEVIIGEHDKSIQEQGQRHVKVTKLVMHPDFNRRTLINDICLLKTEHIHLDALGGGVASRACLPTRDGAHPAPDTKCYTAGWGRMQNKKLPDVLQEVDLPLISDETCQKTRNGPMLKPGMFCAGYLEGGKDACQGDSGGPLICAENGRPVLRGVTSWGWGCAQKNSPGVWTKVQDYLDWIDESR